MTSQEPPPTPDDNNPTSGLPSYGSVPPPEGGYPPPPTGSSDQQHAYGGQGTATQTNKKALWSMILGILGLLCFGLLAGIPAIVLSNMGKKEIAASNGREGGGGMATAGLVLGAISIAWTVLIVIIFISGA